MKRILTLVILLLFAAMAAQAQGPYVRRGGRLKGPEGKLSKAETAAILTDIGGLELKEDWYKANGWRKAGIWMLSGGTVVAVGGAAVFMLGVTVTAIGGAAGAVVGGLVGGEEGASQGAEQGVQAGEPYMTAGLITAGVGAATAVAGIPILIVNCSKMNHMTRDCNSALQLSLASGPNGVGIRLSF